MLAGIEWAGKKSYWLGEGVGDRRAEGSSAIEGGQAAVSPVFHIDGMHILKVWNLKVHRQGIYCTIFQSGCINLHSHQQSILVPFSVHLHQHILPYNSHSYWCEEIPYSGFYLHFSDDEWCWASFHVPANQIYIFSKNMPVQIFCPFLTRLFSYYWVVWILKYILNISPF